MGTKEMINKETEISRLESIKESYMEKADYYRCFGYWKLADDMDDIVQEYQDDIDYLINN